SDHLGGPGGARDAHREAADRPAPHHEDGAALNLGREHCVEGIPHSVHDGADRGRNAVQRQHVGGGHGDVLGERAVAIHADDAGVLADVAVPGTALEAVSAHDMALGGHQLAWPKLGDAIARRHDLPGEFVTHHQRRLDAALRPRVPVGDVDVRAAHPGVRSEEHTSELQSRGHLVCRLLLEKKKKAIPHVHYPDYTNYQPLLVLHAL